VLVPTGLWRFCRGDPNEEGGENGSQEKGLPKPLRREENPAIHSRKKKKKISKRKRWRRKKKQGQQWRTRKAISEKAVSKKVGFFSKEISEQLFCCAKTKRSEWGVVEVERSRVSFKISTFIVGTSFSFISQKLKDKKKKRKKKEN
jgi:hypothetical protein